MTDQSGKPELTVVCWLWQNTNKYLSAHCTFTPHHANTLSRMVARNLTIPHRFVCITDDPDNSAFKCDTMKLWRDYDQQNSHVYQPTHVACYRRLKIFEKETALSFGTPRILSLDLDMVICDNIDGLINQFDAPFVGYRPKLVSRPLTYNGSMFMFKAGNKEVTRIWDTFDIERSSEICKTFNYRGTDQSWISYTFGNRYPYWSNKTGVYSWAKDKLYKSAPGDMKIATFFGKMNPWDAVAMKEPFVRENYR